MSNLPTVTLEEGAMYWVKPRHGKGEGLWTVAKWEVGGFWGVDGEVYPQVISGPIPRPTSAEPDDRAERVGEGPASTAKRDPQ